MNKKSKILAILFVAAIVFSVGITFWRTFVVRDYLISFDVDCDPSSEACFVKACTPDDPENNTCVDTSALVEYHKTLQMKAFAIPACDESNDNCSALNCIGQSADASCVEMLCDNSTEVPEGETCNDPTMYQPPAPPEEGVPASDSLDGSTGEDTSSGTEISVPTQNTKGE